MKEPVKRHQTQGGPTWFPEAPREGKRLHLQALYFSYIKKKASKPDWMWFYINKIENCVVGKKLLVFFLNVLNFFEDIVFPDNSACCVMVSRISIFERKIFALKKVELQSSSVHGLNVYHACLKTNPFQCTVKQNIANNKILPTTSNNNSNKPDFMITIWSHSFWGFVLCPSTQHIYNPRRYKNKKTNMIIWRWLQMCWYSVLFTEHIWLQCSKSNNVSSIPLDSCIRQSLKETWCLF